jgi:hypothetical protein
VVGQINDIGRVQYGLDITIDISVGFAAKQCLSDIHPIDKHYYIGQVALAPGIAVGVACESRRVPSTTGLPAALVAKHCHRHESACRHVWAQEERDILVTIAVKIIDCVVKPVPAAMD